MKVIMTDCTPDAEELICRAARNDYMAGFGAEATFDEVMRPVKGDVLTEKKRTLIGHLLSHGHFGPFEHPSATFAVSGLSRSCMAQLTRHRHASFDVQSMRYVKFSDANVVEPPSIGDPAWVGRNQSDTPDMESTVLSMKRQEVFDRAVTDALGAYEELVNLGVPPEDARYVLPIGTSVNLYMTLNVRQLMHIADMRAAGDAQWEIRELTNEVLDLAEAWCPVTFEYYNDKMRNRKNRLAP